MVKRRLTEDEIRQTMKDHMDLMQAQHPGYKIKPGRVLDWTDNDGKPQVIGTEISPVR